MRVDPRLVLATVTGVADQYVYQIVNLSQEQILFGATDLPLVDEVTRLAKDPKSPAVRWRQGDVIHWRPLTVAMPEHRARVYLAEFEKGVPPNGYTILRTVVPAEADSEVTEPRVRAATAHEHADPTRPSDA